MSVTPVLNSLKTLNNVQLLEVIQQASKLLESLDLNKTCTHNDMSTPHKTEKTTKKLKTEDTGKMFEMAICLAYNIPYSGKYSYGLEKPEELKPRLKKLTELFPIPEHTAQSGSRYDFTSADRHLSAKTTKKGGGKVAPQVIGQPQPKKFCEVIGIPFTDIPHLKEYIQTNITKILPTLVEYTFDCDTVFYNEENSSIQYIKLHTPINWDSYKYTWTTKWDVWNNSSTLKLVQDEKETSLVEFQFHTKSRSNMAIRWCFTEFLTLFKENLTIIDL
jgi:hypothetical protein